MFNEILSGTKPEPTLAELRQAYQELAKERDRMMQEHSAIHSTLIRKQQANIEKAIATGTSVADKDIEKLSDMKVDFEVKLQAVDEGLSTLRTLTEANLVSFYQHRIDAGIPDELESLIRQRRQLIPDVLKRYAVLIVDLERLAYLRLDSQSLKEFSPLNLSHDEASIFIKELEQAHKSSKTPEFRARRDDLNREAEKFERLLSGDIKAEVEKVLAIQEVTA